MEYIKPKDLCIIESENEFVLRRGFLHVNELMIDKRGSSEDFVKALHEFSQDGKAEIIDEDIDEDFLQLLHFGLIDIKSNKNIIVIAGNRTYEKVRECFSDNVKVINVNDILTKEQRTLLNDEKSAVKLNQVYSDVSPLLEVYDKIYYLDSFSEIKNLRAINRLTGELDKEITFGFYDYENIYVTDVLHGTTGCFECLEKEIITKFENTMDYYEEQNDKFGGYEFGKAEINILTGLILKDIDNVVKYGSSSLMGHVLHFYLPNFEYSYNMNRRQVSCPCCASINNTLFEEQNVRAVNLLKRMTKND